MRFYKMIIDGYLIAVGNGSGGEQITETEYNSVLGIIHNKPSAPEGFDYRLKADLTWEMYELPPMPIDDELTAEEALNIITGGNAV